MSQTRYARTHFPSLEIGQWYEQRFSDQIIWFRPTALQKNGGYAGVQYTEDLERPRASIKVKKASVPRTFTDLWRHVPEEGLPPRLRETAHAHSR